MIAFLYYGSVIAAMLLYGNTVSIMKKVKSEEDTVGNTVVGCILSAFILLAIFTVCMG